MTNGTKILRFVATIMMLTAFHVTTIAQKTYYVKAADDLSHNGDGIAVGGDGSTWENAMGLEDALNNAVAGDKIYVKGYKNVRNGEKVYIYPLSVENKSNFLTVKAGVQLYGGFKGDETNINMDNDTREFMDGNKARPLYRSVLVADRLSDDAVDNTLLIYPENPTRADNSARVMLIDLGTENTNRTKTVVSGFTIAGGNATSKTITDGKAYGGGVFVTDSKTTRNSFELSNCFFINNYAERGGAIYVAPSVTGTSNEIKYCELFDNIAGTRGSALNAGGGMWIEGAAKVFNNVVYNNVNGGMRISDNAVVVNNTVTSNTSAAIDMVNPQTQSAKAQIYNTVCWNNDVLSRHSPYPIFRHCAFYSSESAGDTDNDGIDDYGNVLVSHKNRTERAHGSKEKAVRFIQPTTRVGYHRSYMFMKEVYPEWGWGLEQMSSLRNKGLVGDATKTEGYAMVGKMTDAAINGIGRTHTSDNSTYTIDIGAYSYEELAPGRRLFVTQDGNGKKDGSSWENAYPGTDLQTAITTLGNDTKTKGRGEVWVAKGTYVPTLRVANDNDKSPLAFRMYDNVDVYGGFAGTEKELAEREMLDENNDKVARPWKFKNETILSANGFNRTDVNWNETNKEWTFKSNSYHVVWFAPLPGGNDFLHETRLNGFTIEGGYSAQNDNEADVSFMPDNGAGVYIGANAHLQNCIVRYCNSKGNGAGVYAVKGGTVGASLIYNNVATGNGGGVYAEDKAFIMRTMVVNNMADKGGGIYLHNDPTSDSKPYDMLVQTTIVSNNTNRINGAVYTDRGGVLSQCTITNNYTMSATDIADQNASKTGGLYIDSYGFVVNSVLWNNTMKETSDATVTGASSFAQMYTANPSTDNVKFYNCGIMSNNYVVWNNIFQTSTYNLSLDELPLYFTELNTTDNFKTSDDLKKLCGLQSSWKAIDYFWQTAEGLALHAKGLPVGLQPTEVTIKADLDITGEAFGTIPAIGAYASEATPIVPVVINRNNHKVLRVYVDPASSDIDGNGSTWEKNHSEIGEVLTFFGNLNNGQTVKCLTEGKTDQYVDYTIDITKGEGGTALFEVCVREGEIKPYYAYTATDERDYSIRIPRTVCPLNILGGYPSYYKMPSPTDDNRNPSEYRTIMTGTQGDEMTLENNVYHVVRIEDEARPTLNGFSIVRGYAAGGATMPRGGGVLVGSECTAVFMNCILENNTAAYGAAIATTANAENSNVIMTNCVINNNTCDSDAASNANSTETEASRSPYLINISDRQKNEMTLTHVTVVNNIGLPPSSKYIGKTSFSAGNMYKDEMHGETINNTIDIATVGVDGAKNFSNPTNSIGAHALGNVYYGGNSHFRPLTSSTATDVIINKAPRISSSDNPMVGNPEITNPTTDLENNPRDLGGTPDLGAIEADLPKKGNVIYVRSYNQEKPENGAAKDETDGNPDFDLLSKYQATGSEEYVFDGSSWDHAIMGNAVCDITHLDETTNKFYVKTAEGKLMSASFDNTNYSTFQLPNSSSWEKGMGIKATYPDGYYGPISGHYSYFMTNGAIKDYFTGNDGKKTYWDVYQGNTNNLDKSGNTPFNCINNRRYECYVSGLQFAVEKASKYNEAHKDEVGFVPTEVWVGAGVYTDAKGFVIRNGVKVYGSFPSEGNPNKEDRLPLISQYIKERKGYEDKKKSDYETILQVRKESPVYRTKRTDELWYSENKPDDGSYNGIAKELISSGKTQRHYVLYQPDTCVPTWDVAGDGTGSQGGNSYRFLTGNSAHPNYKNHTGQPDNAPYNKPIYDLYDKGKVKWDGFTIRHGYLINYQANRDGGAGVRVFENVELENLIIVNNLAHGYRSRGAGLYMDGQNSKISNSFMLNNFMTNDNAAANTAKVPSDTYINNSNGYGGTDHYGGGAYMIVGTGYNMVVAKNRVSGTGGGGGIFLESATFFNNTVAYNQSNGGATGIQQWSTPSSGIVSNLALYNTIVYGNYGNGNQITSTTPGQFQNAHNCYVENYASNLSTKLSTEYGNITSSNNPFAKGDKSKDEVDFRLSSTSQCLNNGTETLMLNGKKTELPNTDMDFTDRVKDCAVDIGAYEEDNSANIIYDNGKTGMLIYYVTQNGAGNRSGSSPDNAACADKLQNVLRVAGEEAAKETNKDKKVIVKVAGYEPDKDGDTFKYQANTLVEPSDPRSYTFLIPAGVTLKGGYNEDDKNSWDEDYPDSYNRRTILSAKANSTAIESDVYGYHTVTFGSWPEKNLIAWNENALSRPAMVDGCYITDGNANESDGHKALGGGALVPKLGHVRNCVVTSNSAQYGGGIYALSGSVVSTSFITKNNAYYGAGIYADNGDTTDGTDGKRAYIFSNTIGANTASVQGGGIYLEPGAVIAFNDVIWGNNAPSDKNISGTTDKKYQETNLSNIIQEIEGVGLIDGFYPFNNCFAETYLLAANNYNTEMSADATRYFSSNDSFIPRELGPLVHSGLDNSLWNLLKSRSFATHDMLGNEIIMASHTNKLTGGCFAIHVLDPIEDVNATTLFTRLFVSDKGSVYVNKDEAPKYMGRSFYTPFSSLDAALEYINKVRQTKKPDGTTFFANEKTHFDIFIVGGTYLPSLMRKDAAITGTNVRNNSFVIPCNTNLYGGFKPTDNYSCDIKEIVSKDGVKIPLDPNTTTSEMLKKRSMEDLNRNGLFEPWELANQTVLSGNLPNVTGGKKTYHVVYCVNKDTSKKLPGVVLDGITIKDGETADYIDYDGDKEKHNEIGHGGGIFAYGIDMTLNRCRIINNSGIHGGGIFSAGANMTIMNSMVAGNMTQKNNKRPKDTAKGAGVGIFFDAWKNVSPCKFVAVNSIFANNSNETGSGGAVCIANDTRKDHEVMFMNCLFARNEAQTGPDIFNGKSGCAVATNTIFWGSKGDASSLNASETKNCASDKFNITASDANNNITLSTNNEAVNGPYFSKPSEQAGKEGFSLASQWNPTCITVLTDAGDGVIKCDKTSGEETSEEGAYASWLEKMNKAAVDIYMDDNQKVDKYRNEYIKKESSTYKRYMGPKDEDGIQKDKVIDIGPYEYQYKMTFGDLAYLYIGEEDRGDADGTNWDNQSSDLRGALLAAAHPSETSTATETVRTVYVRSGNYYAIPVDNKVFSMNVDENNKKVNRVIIKGACTGVGLGDNAEQNWSNPTVLMKHPVRKSGTLLNIETGTKPVDISGISLRNTYEEDTDKGKGAVITVNGSGGKVVLRQSEARLNKGTAVDVTSNNGDVLIYNSLFADNNADALKSNGKTTVVNCTFAQNINGADIAFNTGADKTQTKVFNSVSWNNKTTDSQVFVSDLDEEDASTHTVYNKVFAAGQANNDLKSGPCFVDTDNADHAKRDYHITPGMKLFERGSLRRYAENVKTGITTTTSDADILSSVGQDRDLGNIKRIVGNAIEVGAYECNAELQPIIFVKDNGNDGTGKSWNDSKNNLQVAVDMAGIYSDLNKGAKSYVFVDHMYGHNSKPANLNVSLPNTYVYGSMKDNPTAPAEITNTEKIAKAILAQRPGIVEEANWRSTIKDLTVSAKSVVDGVQVSKDGKIYLTNEGILSTSVVLSNQDIEGKVENDNGLLYNSLVYADPNATETDAEGKTVGKIKKNVKTVNVTTCGTMEEEQGTRNINNRIIKDLAKEKNRYIVHKYRNCQLNEDDKDNLYDNPNIEEWLVNSKNGQTNHCIELVGHDRDLLGNKRMRNDVVDNGCFETWNITTDKTRVTKDDYPHDASVVYIRKGCELSIDPDLYNSDRNQWFNPGFVLLEHHAGLRGNGNQIGLVRYAVERDMKKNDPQLVALPFSVTKVVPEVNKDYTVKTYNGDKRSRYTYKYSDTHSEAWEKTGIPGNGTGMMLTANNDMTIRFYGGSLLDKAGFLNTNAPQNGDYVENGNKEIVLKQWNHQDSWSSSGTGSDTNRFTHKENMGWNLFGAPRLCATNLSDMEYGRIVYTYNNGKFETRTTDTEESGTDAYIPSMDGLFTQTATLSANNEEHIAISYNGTTHQDKSFYDPVTRMAVAISPIEATPSADYNATNNTAAEAYYDEFAFNAVDATSARDYFDMGADGVKWMQRGRAQIYATSGEARYSLLSAVNRDGEMLLGVSIPENGAYTIAIPDNADTADYEAVVLKDMTTGTESNLLDGAYMFNAGKGEDNNRFTLSFHRLPVNGSGISVSRYGENRVKVEGLQEDDILNIYSSEGFMTNSTVATKETMIMSVDVHGGVAILEVTRNGKRIYLKKMGNR